MNSQLTAFVSLVCTSGVLNLYLCLYVFVRRHHYKKIARYFIVYTAAITVYCFSSGFGLLATTLEQVKFWTMVQYVGMPFSSSLGLLFVMYYLGIKITRKLRVLLFTIPSISWLMVVTNDWHHLHYRVFEVDPILGMPYIYQEIGIWYMIHGITIFSCMFVSFLLLLSRWKETAKAYRLQLLSLLIGQLVPMVTAFIYLTGFTPPGVDPVPMILWLSSALYLWAINSSRMLAIMPIAKDTIFNSINDGVFVLDESRRLIEFNQSCKRMFPELHKSMFGMSFDDIWCVLSGDSFPLKLETTSTKEIQLTTDHSKGIYQVRITPLQHEHDNRQGFLIMFTDITELKRLQVQLEQQAYHDELTKIYNRRAFFQKCEQGFAAAQEHASPFTVILFDIDYFKQVNDTYGHDVGDQLLVHVVKVCQAQLHEDMIFARYGGEEFVIALQGMNVSEGKALANRLRAQVETQPLITSQGAVSVTLSSGVAGIETGNSAMIHTGSGAVEVEVAGETLYQLVNRADQALYSAKHSGRNQVYVYAEA